MPGTFELEVITPERVVIKETVEALVVPGEHGQLGILPRHAPMVVNLGVGVVTYRSHGETYRLAVAGGFFEVSEDKAVVLADTAERAEEIDVDRALAARRRAEERIKRRRDEDVDFKRAQLSLQRALTRLKAASK